MITFPRPDIDFCRVLKALHIVQTQNHLQDISMQANHKESALMDGACND